MKGKIHSFESFGTVDGPGIRFVVFLQGCPMRCLYCHNPDSQNLNGGKEYEAAEVAETVLKYRNYFGEQGGVTVSGGEPLLQIGFVTELFRLLKREGVSTCVDTSGIVFAREEPFLSDFDDLLSVTDLFLLDVKQIDDQKHRALTGRSNRSVLDFARYLSEKGGKAWLRYVLVPGYTDEEEDVRGLAEFVGDQPCFVKAEVLPYHTLGVEKYRKAGIPYPLEGVKPPDRESVERVSRILREAVLSRKEKTDGKTEKENERRRDNAN